MVQIVISVKNTFVHADVDTPDCVEMGCNARRRASSTPARLTLDTAESEIYKAHAFGAKGVEEFLLLPHDADDYTSMHVHPGPSPLDMDVEGMLGCRVLEADHEDYCGLVMTHAEDETTPDFANSGMDIYDAASKVYSASAPHDMNVEDMLGCHVFETNDEDYCALSSTQAEDETARDFVNSGMAIYDAASEDCSASAPTYQGHGAQLPSDNYRESRTQSSSCMSAAPMTPHMLAQRQQFSTFPALPREAQRDSCTQSPSGNSPARVRSNAKHEETQREENHEETQGEEKRTTVMLMNVPLRYTSSKLMCTIESVGFAGMYDFIYVPMTTARNSKGYAFVNWVSPSIAQRFLRAFDGYSSWATTSTNVARAVWAKQHQGLQTNIDRYRNSTVLGRTVPDEYKPRIFNNGVELTFPSPTRKPKSVSTRRAKQPRDNTSQRTLSL